MEWIAGYEDGTCLRQYNVNKTNKYTDIDRSRMISFTIMDGDKTVIKMNLDDGKRLIYRRRVWMDITHKTQRVVLMVGWQQNVKGVNVQHIHLISEDGCIETIPGWSKEWYSPVLLEEEKI